MRIVAGIHRSRRIEAPKGIETRPTLDKTREAVFSSLGGMFDGGIVLDLYAGSGAIGLEAISRGFEHAYFCDPSFRSVQAIRNNIASLREEERTTVLKMTDFSALSLLKEKRVRFDLVYLDPPYAKQHNRKILCYLSDEKMLNDGARVVIESDRNDERIERCGVLVCRKSVDYGISRISYYEILQEME